MALSYVVWRSGTLNPDAILFSASVFAAELFGIGTMLLLLHMCWRLPDRKAPPPPPGLTVDVFITTYNEPVDVVRRTLLAAVGMKYPHMTWLLDDGDREEMRALAQRLGCLYLGRSENTDAKAGNLNNGLKYGTGSIVALFDADHAPHKRFLLETLGYFRDSQVAFVQTPQEFYNLDSYQHRVTRRKRNLWTEQSLFFNIIQRGKDYWNAAFFCGSCAVLRRRALDEIGGFATGSVTEDLHTSLRLHEKGYESVYHPHPLAYGIAVIDVAEYMRQRLRWGQGAMQVWRRERLLSNTNLTLPQRLNYFSSIITYFDGWQRAIFYTVPAFALLSGKLPINITVLEFLLIFLPYLAVTFWTFGVITRGHSHLFLGEEYNFARFAVFCQSTLAFFRRRLRFVVSAKKRNPSPSTLAPLYPQIFILLLSAVAIPVGIFVHYRSGNLALDALIANIFWCGLVMSIAFSLLRFTRVNARHRRQEYRFSIPTCALIKLEGHSEKLVTVEDLSAQGFSFHGDLSGPVESGKKLTGYLHVPSGPMPFRGWIRSIRQAPTDSRRIAATYGCEFEALPEEVVKQLEAFLHGNDLQWHFLRISDHTHKLLRPNGPDALEESKGALFANVGHWQCCTYSRPVELTLREFQGVVSSAGVGPDEDRKMVLMQEVPEGTSVMITVGGSDDTQELFGEVTEDGRVETADGPVYLYTLQNVRSMTTWKRSSA
ncbi:cellulose synthase (UDP-forming) [Natronocella acetinitrilica]|uniref:Cellulose synthase (UDP-forming) n=1 Tax=Natronocella acetinitrilica TaxID=414046 RepID=A0AAE3KDB9_9GAMM|nr:cellulose synthase (UDP-forming) [Natronocella acetinitrilica]